ncbi:MAG TPA: site-specific DNA-methyltransferase [Terriglobia bacterium]|nr:site-specific DNA-methyltransferase [Terriglobia bacterium]
MARTKEARRTQVESVRHKDKRRNIPTEELRDFVAEDEQHPKAMLYPRDPSLDPQLVWKGKDEQDAKPLQVPVVPVYIQEKIHPQALIEDFRQTAKEGQAAQADLFADFNGIKFEEMVDFYHHEQNWSNRMILGDSLLVMTSLAEKEGLKGKAQMIYIDPPYGIRFGSNWQVSTRKRDVRDGKAEDATRQPEQVRAFRDTWELGIHSYLAYLRDRLVAARELLTETGSVFVQIGDENLHLVRCVLDEVFGSGNFVSLISVTKTSSATAQLLAGTADYLLFYAKDASRVKYRQIYLEKEAGGLGASGYSRIESADGKRSSLSGDGADSARIEDDRGRLYTVDNLTSQRPPGDFPVAYQGEEYRPAKGYWKTHPKGMQTLVNAGRVELIGNTLRYVRYIDDFAVFPIANVWTDTGVAGFASEKRYVVETSPKIVERCLLMASDPGDLVIDPTCGSGTTAYVAEQWGRRWITIDTSRVALALARTRLVAAKYPYYLLADSPEGVRKGAETSGTTAELVKATQSEIKKGFVYKRVPHVMLKSIANNDEIDAIHAKWQEKLEPVRASLNKAVKRAWQEWEIPREADAAWPESTRKLHDEWWRIRRERQKEIDDSIARHAETELLYDQPYEDQKRVRVTGPFTVESLSPHRALSDDGHPVTVTAAREESSAGSFEAMIVENLKKAGVQNTVKSERLTFDRLELYPGVWLQAAGEYTEKDGKVRRVAVSIGPEHGTVSPEQVKEAAKEAVQGIGFETLIVCGFYFDPHVSEEAKRYGKLTVLTARMNYDLTMGDELLKKTGAGNLFVIYGEPDLEVRKEKDGKLVVEIKGVDVYDPTTGQIRSHTTDDIACWFIDTAYNGESFFVRHAYFTGDTDPYERLKRALRAEIDEATWQALYSTVSRPFDPPKTGKIAVKVINHYGDEVLKVYPVSKGGSGGT